ncbi:unnamed protein product, partial [Amoebophrya sp. A25]
AKPAPGTAATAMAASSAAELPTGTPVAAPPTSNPASASGGADATPALEHESYKELITR